MKLFTRKDEILMKSRPLARDEVPTPEWGEDTGVLVQALSAGDYLDIYGNNSTRDSAQLTGLICARGIIDPEGNRIYEDDDVPELLQQEYGPIARIADRVLDLTNLEPGGGSRAAKKG